MSDSYITILNFKCNNCGVSAGQLIHKIEDGEDKEKIRCKDCGSDDCTYETAL